MRSRPPWSERRRRTVLALALGVVLGGLGAVGLPGEYAVPAGAVARVVRVPPGRGRGGRRRRARARHGRHPRALGTGGRLRLVWSLVALAAATWTGYALWVTRRAGE